MSNKINLFLFLICTMLPHLQSVRRPSAGVDVRSRRWTTPVSDGDVLYEGEREAKLTMSAVVAALDIKESERKPGEDGGVRADVDADCKEARSMKRRQEHKG